MGPPSAARIYDEDFAVTHRSDRPDRGGLKKDECAARGRDLRGFRESLLKGHRWVQGAFIACCLAGLIASPATAQGRVGGQGMYQSELLGGSFGVGGRAQLDLGFIFPGLSLMGTYDYFFPSDCPAGCSLWESSGNVIMSGGPAFYFGAGTAFQRFDRPDDLPTTEDWLVNFLVGINIPGTAFLTPFVEARFEAFSETTNQVVFSAGAMFGPRARPAAPGRGR